MLTHTLATPADYPRLTAIWTRSVTATHHFLSLADREAIQRDLPRYFAQVTLWRWQLDEHLIGFTGMAGSDLAMLFLDPTYFRHGYGQQIIRILMKTANLQTVTVNAQNPGALAFYQRQGFKIISQNSLDADGRSYPIINLSLT